MSARALARMYAALVGEVEGVSLISPRRTAQIATPWTTQTDRVLGAPIAKGLGYFMGLPEMVQAQQPSAGRGAAEASPTPTRRPGSHSRSLTVV